MKYVNLDKIYKQVSKEVEEYNNSSRKGDFNDFIKILNEKFKLNIDSNNKSGPGIIDADSIFQLIKDELMGKYLSGNFKSPGDSSIRKIAKKDSQYVLSSSQERLFVLHNLESGSSLYNINIVIKLKRDISIKHFKKAVEFITQRHAVLRTKFMEVNGRPVQKVSDKHVAKLRVQTLASSGNRKKDNIAKETAIGKIIEAPFDLAEDVPFRVVLLTYQNKNSNIRQKTSGVLVVSVHHIAADQWSIRILLKELFSAYEAYLNNQMPELTPLNIQYKDFAEWEQSPKNQKRLAKQKEYWLSRLTPNPPVTALPLDYPRDSILEYEKGYLRDYLDNRTIQKLREMAGRHNASLFMTLFAIFNLYVAKLTGKDDIIVGITAINRKNPDLTNLVGNISNDIPIRVKLSDRTTFGELLRRIRRYILSDYQNSEYPLEKLVDDLSSTRDMRSVRLFNSVIHINENNKEHLCAKDIRNGRINHQAINNDWGVIFEIYKDKTRLSCEYNAAVLKEQTIQSWASDLVSLIKQVANDPDRQIADYEAIAPATREKLLHKFNDTAKYQHPTKAPHHYFEAQARKNPHKTAVVYEKKKISYGKLNSEANQLANCLLDQGIEKGDTVAIDIGEAHYLDIPQAILAIHKAGAAAVLIDREHPRERIRYILEKSRAKAIISDNPAPSYQVGRQDGRQKITLIDITEKRDQYSPRKPKGRGITGTDTAFITFTSGTTGVPKGIKITARALVNEVYHKIDHLNELNISAIPQNFLLVYNPALEFICTSFVLGKKLIIYPQSEIYDPYTVMARTAKEKIKFLWLTPSVLSAYLEMIETGSKERIPLKDLALINLTGEKTHPGLARRFYGLYGHITLTTDGGCSEALSYSNGIIPRNKNLSVIKDGQTTRNQQIYVLDKRRGLLPIGATGEIYVSGYGLANGYIDKRQTGKRFLPHPFIKGKKIYRTGDRGRFDNEGNIEIKGRVDDQVKIRGQRMEPDEIAEKIRKIAGIGDVLVRPFEKGKNYELALACYYSLKVGNGLTAHQIQATLRKEVPQFMIPAYFIALPAFPLNRNGKIDKGKLPAPTEKHLLKTGYVGPKTESEKMVARIWREVLKIEKISRHDSFFDLGGHSLKAISALARINQAFDIDLELKLIFENPVLRELAVILERAAGRKNRAAAIRIPPAPKKEYYPLSHAQRRLWVLYKLEPDSPSFNSSYAAGIKGKLDAEKLEGTIYKIQERHEILRTNFLEINGEPAQIIHKKPRAKLEIRDISRLNKSEQTSAEEEIIRDIAMASFRLETDPLARFILIKKSADQFTLIVVRHSLVYDDWSNNIFNRELADIYNAYTKGEEPDLPRLDIQYKDYAVFELSKNNEKRLARQEKYWLAKLSGDLPVVNLPSDKARPNKITYQGAVLSVNLGPRAGRQLKKLAEEHNTTLFILLISIFNILVSKLTGQKDIIIGTLAANRGHQDLENVMGILHNNIAIRSDLSGEMGFREWLQTAHKDILEDLSNNEYSFDHLITKLKVPRDIGLSPVFSIVFQVLRRKRFTIPALNNIKIFDRSIKRTTTEFDLHCTVIEAAGGDIRINFNYATDIFTEDNVKGYLRYFRELIKNVLKDPDKKIADLEILPAEDKRKLISGYNNTKKPYPKGKTIHRLIEEQVQRTPDNIAIMYANRSLSYRQLNAKANRLARYLQDRRKIKPDDIVAIMLDRSPEMIIAILAVLKAGAAYLPLDPEYPRERIKYMLLDSRARILISNKDNIKNLQITNYKLQIFNISKKSLYENYPIKDPKSTAKPTNLAYIIYTSGSTGKPKGVMVEHRAVLNTLFWLQDEFKLAPGKDAVAQKTSQAFTDSVWEIFWPLLNGCPLVIIDDDTVKDPVRFIRKIDQHKITYTQFVPALMSMFLEGVQARKMENKKILPNLKYVFNGGEHLPPKLPNEWYRTFPNVKIANIYGMTESAIYAAKYIVPEKSDENDISVPLGKPIANTGIYILDKYGKLLPPGIPGEIAIAGPGLARGYRNKPKETEKSFFDHPQLKIRLYRTGDRGRLDSDYILRYLGRTDRQAKIRGCRVELGEIENRLNKLLGLGNVIVVAHKDKNGSDRLFAFYTGQRGISSDSIKDFAKATLPGYMIPAEFIKVRKFLLNSNGKVDRNNLLENIGKFTEQKKKYTPVSSTEKILYKIWREILDLKSLLSDDDFFDLGGHSLSAIHLLHHITQDFKIEVPLESIFNNSKFSDQVELIEKEILKVSY